MRLQMRGVTLIELMVVIVIIGILASIAIPSYRNYVVRAQRTDATSALLRVAAAQEKYYLQNNSYATNAQLAALGLNVTEHGWYTLAVTTTNGLTRDFTVTATAVTGGPQASDSACPSFSIDSSGTKLPPPNSNCWR